jgi:hypothetical protein
MNEVGRLKLRINMHSAAAIFSLTLGYPKFLEI